MQHAELLRRWRATALAEHLWEHWAGRRAFVLLEPRLLETNPSGPRHPDLGRAGQPVRAARPSALVVRVPELEELGIERHELLLTATEFEVGMADLSEHERAVLLEYLQRPRRGAVYGYKTHRRRRADGSVYVLPYITPTAGAGTTLLRAMHALLDLADPLPVASATAEDAA